MERILVTGAAGFIGSTLVERLLSMGVEHVRAIDSFTPYYDIDQKRRNIEAFRRSSRVQFLDANLLEANIDDLVRDVDTVFHLAGQPGVRPSWGQSFTEYSRNNIEATQQLLEALRASNSLRRVVYASSSSVYGNAERYPTLETDTPRPLSPYGVSKLAGEHLMSLYAQNFGVPTVSLRYFTVFGPRQRPDMAFHRFIRTGLQGGEISVFGDGEQVRDFTYVDDIVEANIRGALAQQIAPGSIYNVSGGVSTTVNEVLGVIEEALGRHLNIAYSEAVAGDARVTSGEAGRAHSELGWSPAVSLKEGLGREIAWLADS